MRGHIISAHSMDDSDHESDTDGEQSHVVVFRPGDT